MRQVLACLFGLSIWVIAQACVIEVHDFPAGLDPAGGNGGSALGGMGGSGAAGAAAVDSLMRTCESDAECGDELDCFTPAQAPWGFPGGACTKTCIGDFDCPAGGKCHNDLCFLSCDIGGPAADKCRGRTDLACERGGPDGESYDFCSPVCERDDECPGRYCDRFTGRCTDQEATGSQAAISSCTTPDLGDDPCLGCCQGGGCYERCRIGDNAPCGDSSLVCNGTTEGAADGDVGYCTIGCTTALQCPGTYTCQGGKCAPNLLGLGQECSG